MCRARANSIASLFATLCLTAVLQVTLLSPEGAGTRLLAQQVETPRVLDDRLEISLFAASPDIVTPTGISVDNKGQIYVIETHTHFRTDNYEGPPADRIRVFSDTDGDGRAEKATTFFEGTSATMSLAQYHDGSFFVATRKELFRLRDSNGDGRADSRKTIVWLNTKGVYPHDGLSGFAFDLAGNIYFGLGENLGFAYTVVGTDGTTISGGGEGGSVYRCRANGTGLIRLATGFWNPFHLCLDSFERLFVVDNDPDWRPPCRLIHVVPGADYGYRFRNGRRGVHPFTSWFGKTPGTLGMVAGTGEAPSGLIAYQSDGLPAEYRGSLLSTSWGFHAIEQFDLQRQGATFRSAAKTIIKGDEHFRPVGIALAPDGSLYVSDWGSKAYETHGKGRIWRIRWRDAPPPSRPADPHEAVTSAHRPLREQAARHLATTERGRLKLTQMVKHGSTAKDRALGLLALSVSEDGVSGLLEMALADNSADLRALAIRTLPMQSTRAVSLARESKTNLERAAALRRLKTRDAWPAIGPALQDDDPFIRQAARYALSKWATPGGLLRLSKSTDAAHRVAALLLLRDANDPKGLGQLPTFLGDSDPRVRQIAAQWIGEAGLKEHASRLRADLVAGRASGDLFDVYLAALDMLREDRQPPAFEDDSEALTAELLSTANLAAPALAATLERLRTDHPLLTADRFFSLLKHSSAQVRREAIRSLRTSPIAEREALLLTAAIDSDQSEALRAEAIMGLSPDQRHSRSLLLQHASGNNGAIRTAALQQLALSELTSTEAKQIRAAGMTPAAVGQLVGRAADPAWKPAGRPQSLRAEAWRALATGGDPVAGEQVFFGSTTARCVSCHRVGGRGGRIGPDLSTIGAMRAERIMQSILTPSEDIAPQFVTWIVQKEDGTVTTGVLVDERGETQRYADAQGKMVPVNRSEITDRKPLSTSIMPDRLTDQLTDQELRDLMAYLQSCR